jgi:hypothetical protein
MAYSSTNPVFQLNPGNLVNGKNAMWLYQSTHDSTGIIGTGFFSGCGYGGRAPTQSSSSYAANQIPGLQIGDIVLNISSTDALVPGRVTLHSVLSSTADQASTSASSGWGTRYDVTVASAT